MENESISRLITRFAGPALIGMLANALYNIVDRIFVGHIVGAKGIAAIAVSFPCMLLSTSIGFLIGIGAASRISILMGEGKRQKAEQTLGNSLSISLVLGVLFLCGGRLLFRQILGLSGASETIYPIASEYLSVVLYGVLFSIVSFTLSCGIKASGSPSYAMGSQAIGAMANIVLDALFVVCLDMGVRGAALATVISQVISAVWAVVYFFLPGAALRLRRRFVLSVDREAFARIFAVGVPSCLVQLNFVLVHGMITYTSNRYGGDLAVSATGIFVSLDSLLFMPAVAIADACQPIVGFNYGAKKIDRVIATVRTGVLITSVFYAVSFIIIMTNAEIFVRMFNSTDQELIRTTATAMRFANIGLPFMGISIVNSSLLQGLGRGREGMILAAIRFGLFLWMPLLILPGIFGLYGAWGSFPVSDIGGTVASGLSMYYTIKRLKKEGRPA
ncbi:MAG: MATE family efflux transporter [Synergistaceae bacterium]|jgi:putative MATE family efflux protein|nr:MATE family efflux transporter [Synergistaceae bacterium]